VLRTRSDGQKEIEILVLRLWVPVSSRGKLGQLVTGTMSDRYGRKPFIAGGMLLQAGALALVALGGSFGVWASATVLLGVGTAMVYPTLLAAIGDVAHPTWRVRSTATTHSRTLPKGC
jgi:MFS family permease